MTHGRCNVCRARCPVLEPAAAVLTPSAAWWQAGAHGSMQALVDGLAQRAGVSFAVELPDGRICRGDERGPGPAEPALERTREPVARASPFERLAGPGQGQCPGALRLGDR